MQTETSNSPPSWVQRQAKLFEAGEYPDKGVSVTEAHLAQLAAGFLRPVPLLIEHADSPLQMGYLTQVEARGSELFGTLSLSEEANQLVESSGARSLSLGLSPDLAEIREVSLVRNPRVPSAQLFSDGVVFLADLPDDAALWRERYRALEQETRNKEVDRKLSGYLKRGKLCPAQVPFARALLACDDTVEFDGAKQPLRKLLIAMIDRQPPSNLFHETAGTPAPPENPLLLPEEASFYRRHFPHIALKDIVGAD